jgi:hypothetical protein
MSGAVVGPIKDEIKSKCMKEIRMKPRHKMKVSALRSPVLRVSDESKGVLKGLLRGLLTFCFCKI